jgi:hypothetical protein
MALAMNAMYFILQADGSHAGPVPQSQVVVYLHQGVLRPESLVRRADLAEFFAVESYPEFTQVVSTPVAVPPPRPSAVARFGKPPAPKLATPKPAPPTGGRTLIWCMIVVWVILLGWGAKAGWDYWQENSAKKQQAEAKAWIDANPPEYQVTKTTMDRGKGQGAEYGLIIHVLVEEKAPKIHPVHGRAERSEVYARLRLVLEGRGPVDWVLFDLEPVRIRDGKGDLTVIKSVSEEAFLKMLAMWKELRIEAEIQNTKK